MSVRQKSDGQTIVIRFKSDAEIETFQNQIEGIRKGSLFDQRTDVSSAVQYFQVWMNVMTCVLYVIVLVEYVHFKAQHAFYFTHVFSFLALVTSSTAT